MEINEKKLRKIIHEEVFKALEVNVTWERHTDDQGKPLPYPETKTEKSNVTVLLHMFIPRIEGALRGMQEDVSKMKNKVDENTNSLQAITSIFFALENSIRQVAQVSEELKQLNPIVEGKLLEEGHKEV